jgi:hypothetical protein
MSRKGPFIVFRIIGFLLLVALLIGGGAMAYKAGVMQGISQAPAVATAISKAAESGQSAPVPPMYGREFGYGYGGGYPMMYGHHFGFFPIGAICGSIFFLFLFFGFIKMMFFRRMMWGGFGHHHRPDDGLPWGGPPWMRNHNCEENKEGEKKEGEGKEESKKE